MADKALNEFTAAAGNLAATDLIFGMVGGTGDSDKFTGQQIADGVSTILGGVGSSPPFADDTALVKDNADATKLLRFEASGITTATTRVATIPDRDFTLDTVTIGTTVVASGNSGSLLYDGTGVVQIDNSIKRTASGTLNVGQSGVAGKVQLVNAAGSVVGLCADASSGSYVFSFPTSVGSSGQVLKSTGSGTAWSTGTLTLTGNLTVSSTTTLSGGTHSGTNTGDVTLSGLNHLSFTGQVLTASCALGDVIYGSASNTFSKLTGNTTSTKKYLSQTGTGAVSAAPAWAQIAASDLSNGIQGTAGQKVVLLDAVAEKTVSVTISSGVATVGDISGYYGTVIIELDGEGAAADTLDEIQGTFREGQKIYCKAASSARDITYSHNTGTGDDTLYIAGGSVTLATVRGTICFMRRSFGGNNVWVSICVSDP